MTLRQKTLPSVPNGVAMKALAPSLKLFSELEIRDIKKRFKQNGRYRHYVDEYGMQHSLKYPVFVFNGTYFASYPGKLFLVHDASYEKVKVAQNLDSGEWVDEKILASVTVDEMAREEKLLKGDPDVVSASDEVMQIFRAAKTSPDFNSDANENRQFFGGNIDEIDSGFDLSQREEVRGKGYFFKRRTQEAKFEELADQEVRVAILDMEDFYLASERGVPALDDYIQSLQCYHFIYLFDAGDVTQDQELLAVKHKLESYRIMVSQQVMIATHAEMRAFIALNNISTTSGHRYNIHFITSTPDEVVSELVHEEAVRELRIDFSGTESDSDDSNDLLMPPLQSEAERYSLCQCLTWFFSSLTEDVCHAITGRRRSRFDIFSRTPSPTSEPDEPEVGSKQWEQLRKMV